MPGSVFLLFFFFFCINKQAFSWFPTSLEKSWWKRGRDLAKGSWTLWESQEGNKNWDENCGAIRRDENTFQICFSGYLWTCHIAPTNQMESFVLCGNDMMLVNIRVLNFWQIKIYEKESRFHIFYFLWLLRKTYRPTNFISTLISYFCVC